MMKIKNRQTLPEITKKYQTTHRLKDLIVAHQSRQIEQLGQFLEQHGMQLFFNNLQHFLTQNMLGYYKKNAILQNGVYILIDGKVTLVWNDDKSDYSLKKHLFSLAKNGIYSALKFNPYQNMNQSFKHGFSMLIYQSFSVIQSQNNNVMVMEESTLLKIPQVYLQQINFYELCSLRTQVCQKAKLPIQTLNINSPLISLNTKLHHLFVSRKFSFHNRFRLQNYGIIRQGAVLVKNSRTRKIEGFKHALLFPEIDYEVVSSEIQILELKGNPTLLFNNIAGIQEFLSEVSVRKIVSKSIPCDYKGSRKTQGRQFKRNNSYRVSLKSIQNLNPVETKRRNKDKASFSKMYENYLIVSTNFCNETLNYTKKSNSKKFKTKNPRVLFKYSQQKQQKNQLQVASNQCSPKKTSKLTDLSLMQRYQNISKDLYQKFIFNAKKKNENLKVQQSSLRK